MEFLFETKENKQRQQETDKISVWIFNEQLLAKYRNSSLISGRKVRMENTLVNLEAKTGLSKRVKSLNHLDSI